MAEQKDIVELVKEKNLIEDVVEADGFPLPKKRSRYLRSPGQGGLIVDVAQQCYHWNSKDEHGDVINWTMNRQRCDFKAAVELLCRRSGLPDPNWGHEDPAHRLAVRAKEEALDVAARVFARWYQDSQEAQAYATGRGWSTWLEKDAGTQGDAAGQEEEAEPGTIVRARLGYSGNGSDREYADMRHELLQAGVDVDSPVAVAILGYKGDVAGWAKRHNIRLSDDVLIKSYIPGMVGKKRLVYPHLRYGRVTYLSGRGIDVKFHFNLVGDLVGQREPYFNHVYAPKAEACVIVEGQADAISLAQWGVPAVALAGVTPGADLAELLKGHEALYVGLDDDDAGQNNAWKIADALGPLTRLLNWKTAGFATFRRGEETADVKDANDLLRAMNQGSENDESQKAFVRGLMAEAVTYVERVCYWAGHQEGAARDKALPQALKVVSRLDELQLTQYRSDLAKLLKMNQRDMTAMLKALVAVQEREQSDGEPIYTWGGCVDGWLLEFLYDAELDRAQLAWKDPQGNVNFGDSVIIEGRKYLPYPINETLRSGAMQFPSALGNRKSIRELVANLELYLHSIYLMPSDKMARLVAYWVLTTWLYDSFETVIYLRAMGGAGSGKSELIKRIGLVCYRTMTANGAGSTSSLFRAVERYKGTVLLDEADLQQSDTEADMVKFYNLGAMRGNPIWRTVEVVGPNGEKDWEERGFQTFCPKLIAMRKEFRDDAVGTRSITLKLVPREMTELKAGGIPLTINNSIRQRAQALRNALVRWRLESWQPEIEVDPEFYDLTISARLNQVAGPLLAMARDDPEQQEDIRHTLREYYAETILTMSMTLPARVIEAMWKIWQNPTLREQMVKTESDGQMVIKIGDITKVTNQIINEMNDEESNEEEEAEKKFGSGREVKSQRIGRIIRQDLQIQVSERRRDGFWAYWNEPKMLGLSTKFGINPEDFKPAPGQATQARL